VLLLNQNAERKREHITDPAQQRRSHDHHRRFRLRIHGPSKAPSCENSSTPIYGFCDAINAIGYAMHSSR
jgi:hypothetical protein